MKQKICIAGKNRISIEAMQLFLDLDMFDLFAIPNDGDIGLDEWQPSFRKYVIDQDINIISIKDSQNIEGLVFLSLEYDKLLKVDEFKNATLLNIHFSNLPSYKGCFTAIWPLINGEKSVGVTLHLIDSGIDTGDIIDKAVFDLSENITSIELYELYQDSAVRLLEKNISRFLTGDFNNASKQCMQNASYYSRNSLSKIDPEINFNLCAFQIKNHVRALFFPIYQTATYDEYRIKECFILNERSKYKPGTIVKKDPSCIRVCTIDFDVLLKICNKENVTFNQKG
ncbi:formyltransferase family protein [Shewanella sp.]|uniref:formyltransferase family protein n=1 Tax=Shewanella sp. TaxID=50422 RepID=UPI0040477321